MAPSCVPIIPAWRDGGRPRSTLLNREQGEGRVQGQRAAWEIHTSIRTKREQKIAALHHLKFFFFVHQRLIASRPILRLFFAQGSNLLKKRARCNGCDVGSEEPHWGSLAGFERCVSP
jgi:hypothetical protein